MNTNNNIELTPDTVNKLKIAYDKAVKDNKLSFMFQGNEILVAYAKYALEYAESEFERKKRKFK
jgi:hypothetical protein